MVAGINSTAGAVAAIPATAIAAHTDHGLRQFTMRWSQSHVQDFGERGKVLLDLDDNRYLVPDVEALPPRERDLFQRYVYW